MGVETELRLGIDAAAVPRLLRHPAVQAAKLRRTSRCRITSSYFDTPQCALARHGIALRLRHDGTRWQQAVKGPSHSPSGMLAVREEYEWPLPDGRLLPALFAMTPWQRTLVRAADTAGFAPRFVTDFTRQTIPLGLANGTSALLCIDTGVIRDSAAPREWAIAELEIELVAGDPIAVFSFAARLAADLPLTAGIDSKAARGYALAAGRPDRPWAPVRATAVPLTATLPTVEAFGAIIGECLRQVTANAAGLLTDGDPEWIHQMRVGTRRLRSIIGMMARMVPPNGLAPLLGELRWLAAALGEARDWDVFDEATLRPLARALDSPDATERALRGLGTAAAEARDRTRVAARAAVGSSRFTRLLLAVNALVAAPSARWFAAGLAEAEGAQPIVGFAAELLDRRAARLRARAKRLVDGTTDERHAVRIAAKQLRYVAEFFAPVAAEHGRARRYIAALARLQAVLGDLNDAASAQRLAGTLARNQPELAVAVAAVGGWHAARRANLDTALGDAWKRFGRAPAFWRRR